MTSGCQGSQNMFLLGLYFAGVVLNGFRAQQSAFFLKELNGREPTWRELHDFMRDGRRGLLASAAAAVVTYRVQQTVEAISEQDKERIDKEVNEDLKTVTELTKMPEAEKRFNGLLYHEVSSYLAHDEQGQEYNRRRSIF